MAVIEEEIRAFVDIFGKKRFGTLIGIGSLWDVEHCFRLGFPDVLVLFDPTWSGSRYEESTQRELDLIKKWADKSNPPRFIEQSMGVDTAEFFFNRQKVTVYFYKAMYDPDCLGKYKPDIIHMGHATVIVTDKDLLQTMLLLPKGAVIMNFFNMNMLFNYIFSYYFLDIKGCYKHKMQIHMRTDCIFVKNKDIDEKEIVLVHKFANAISTLISRMQTQEHIDELKKNKAEQIAEEQKKWGHLPKEQLEKHALLGQFIRHERLLSESLKILEILWRVFSTAQKKKLINLVHEFPGEEKEFVDRAIKIANLK